MSGEERKTYFMKVGAPVCTLCTPANCTPFWIFIDGHTVINAALSIRPIDDDFSLMLL